MHKIGATIRDSSKTITGAYLTEHFCKFLKAWNKLAVKCNLLKEWKFYLRVAKLRLLLAILKVKSRLSTYEEVIGKNGMISEDLFIKDWQYHT